MRVKRGFPTQARLHELLERHYDSEGKLFFVAKVGRGSVQVGDVLYGYRFTANKGCKSEHTRVALGIDGFVQQIAVWNFIWEYGDYDRKLYTVDHIDRNSNNDKHTNLRLATRKQQAQNRGKADRSKTRKVFKKSGSSSIYFGVCKEEKTGRWKSQISIFGKRRWLGYYDDEIEAARRYDEESWLHYKDYTQLNFPDNYQPET